MAREVCRTKQCGLAPIAGSLGAMPGAGEPKSLDQKSGGSPRYTFVRELGRGGMGQVALVFDHERKQHVAQKRVLRSDPDSLVRIKREFRAVREVLHPNLLRLYELGQDERGPFFTMQVVAGSDFCAYCRQVEEPGCGSSKPRVSGVRRMDPTELAPTLRADASETSHAAPTVVREHAQVPAPSLTRLAHVLPQLLEALAFLHAHGIVHRDLKPTNVLVTTEGVVKVLDFGILAELGEAPSGGPALGTLGYAAPEQLTGAAPSPAMDLYGLGAMLFELFSGRLPREPSSLLAYLRELDQPAPTLRSVASDAPLALAELVDALLSVDAGARPDLSRVAAALGVLPGCRAAVLSTPPAPSSRGLVGRDDEVAALSSRLSAALERPEGGGMLVLAGPTGGGKTALAEHVLEGLSRDGLLTFKGRGRSSERVAYNLLDAALDSLAVHLAAPEMAPWCGAHAPWISAVSTVFPVMASDEPPPSGIGRRESFEALFDVLAALSSSRERPGLVLFTDDLQWADDDSLSLVEHLLDSVVRGVTVLATLRDDIALGAGVRRLLRRTDVHVQPVERLDAASIAKIIERSARGASGGVSPGAMREAVAACDGRPMLAELTGAMMGHRCEAPGKSVGLSLDAVLATLDVSGRKVLATLAAADAWVDLDRLGELTDLNPGELADRSDELALMRLIRRDRSDERRSGLERAHIYHDSIRVALQASLGDDEKRAAHAAHARLILREPGASPVKLVRHLLGAGETVEAARHAERAARSAARQKAYGLAADMYEVALRHPQGDGTNLQQERASMLVQAGRYREAAEAWRHVASTHPEGQLRADARLHEAHALLAAGSLSEGHACLLASLHGLAGRPRLGKISELTSGARFLAGPRFLARRHPRVAYSDRGTRETERDFRIATMLGYFDPVAGVHFLMHALDRNRRAGLAREEAWCCYILGYFALNGTAAPGRSRLADAYLEHANRVVERLPDRDPLLEVLPVMIEGCQTMRCGAFDRAATLLDQVVQGLRDGGSAGTFEHLYTLTQCMMLDAARQDFPSLSERVGRARAAMRDVHDSALRVSIECMDMWADAFRGNLDRASEKAAVVRSLLPGDHPTIQRLVTDFLGMLPDLYLTDCRSLRVRVREALRRGRRFSPMNQWSTSTFAAIAALVEANALRAGDPDASTRRVEHFARIVDRSAVTLPGASWRARAYAADARGKRDEALGLLERAETTSLSYRQRVDAAIARYQRGRRLGDDELTRSAVRWVEQAGSAPAILREDVGLR